MYSIIFDNHLFEEKIEEVRKLALSLSLNENEISSHLSKYPKHVFAPLEEYLHESFIKGIINKGKDFAEKFTKGAKEIATKISSSVKEFSYKKVFLAISKMMNKIKAKVLKSLMILLSPLREVIIKNEFCDENNTFNSKITLRKLISISKEVGKDIGSEELLNQTIVNSIEKNINLKGTHALTESEEEENRIGKAKFDDDDVKYLDFFQKILYRLGIKGAKLNGFLSEIAKKVSIGAAVTGVVAIISSLFPSAGIISGIAAAAGAAVSAAPVLVMIIGAILFGIGLFMFATWLLKPYPTIRNCRIFLGTIFSGAHPFDFPETTLDDLGNNTKSIENAKPRKSPFNYDVITDLKDEEIDQDIPTENSNDIKKEFKDIVKMYDDLDIDFLEDDNKVEKNISLSRYFARNISTKRGRDRIQNYILELRDEDEDTEYTDKIEDFLELINEIYDSEAIELTNDEGKKLYPYALNYKSVQKYLRSKNNSVADRITKIIDVTDNFIDRIEKKLAKEN